MSPTCCPIWPRTCATPGNDRCPQTGSLPGGSAEGFPGYVGLQAFPPRRRNLLDPDQDDRRAVEMLEPAGIVMDELQSYFEPILNYARVARWGKTPLTRQGAMLARAA